MVESHSERQIYDECINLMNTLVGYFEEYLDYLGYEINEMEDDEIFGVGISNMEIVRALFLSGTTHSGGTSTIEKCRELGIDWGEQVKFRIQKEEE